MHHKYRVLPSLQDWEAVVLIPFIDEMKLLAAMETCDPYLTREEKARNTHGPMYIYSHTEQNLGDYQVRPQTVREKKRIPVTNK